MDLHLSIHAVAEDYFRFAFDLTKIDKYAQRNNRISFD